MSVEQTSEREIAKPLFLDMSHLGGLVRLFALGCQTCQMSGAVLGSLLQLDHCS